MHLNSKQQTFDKEIIHMHVEEIPVKISFCFILQLVLQTNIWISGSCSHNSHATAPIWGVFWITWSFGYERNFGFIFTHLLHEFIDLAKLIRPSPVVQKLPKIKPVIFWWITLSIIGKHKNHCVVAYKNFRESTLHHMQWQREDTYLSMIWGC